MREEKRGLGGDGIGLGEDGIGLWGWCGGEHDEGKHAGSRSCHILRACLQCLQAVVLPATTHAISRGFSGRKKERARSDAGGRAERNPIHTTFLFFLYFKAMDVYLGICNLQWRQVAVEALSEARQMCKAKASAYLDPVGASARAAKRR